MRITKQELENSKPGTCVTCGKYEPAGRNTAGQCTDCHNKAVLAQREKRKADIARAKEEGKRYWAERGIKPGDVVIWEAPSLLGVTRIKGTAKVGVNGAYVYTKSYGQLDPAGWKKYS